MFEHLQIYDARERALVGCADACLSAGAAIARRAGRRRPADAPRDILILRLERIGDLLMTRRALDAVRRRAPGARLHLVVGSWNAPLARLLPGIDSVEALDVPWLARERSGASASGLVRRAWAWRSRRFDLALNFEPDIRSNALLALSGAPRRVGFSSGGGGPLLTDSLAYEPNAHTAANAMRVVDAALPGAVLAAGGDGSEVRLAVPDRARQDAAQLLGRGDGRQVLVGIHPSGGRASKQWHPERFAEVGARLARDFSATLVLTGTSEDRPLVDRVISLLPESVARIDAAGAMELPVLAGVLERLALLVTGDTGPMHLAAAVGTPVVALFGPSDPDRYGPLSDRAAVVTTDLWCRPCNRVRRPPARCTGRVPDCLDGIGVEAVCAAADRLLR